MGRIQVRLAPPVGRLPRPSPLATLAFLLEFLIFYFGKSQFRAERLGPRSMASARSSRPRTARAPLPSPTPSLILSFAFFLL